MDAQSQTGLALRFRAGLPESVEDALASEGALQITLNQKPYTVTMRTPGDDEWLAKGLLFTEGLIDRWEEAKAYRESALGDGRASTLAEMTIDPARLNGGGAERSLISNAACGVCGKTALNGLFPATPPLSSSAKLSVGLLPVLEKKMGEAQGLFRKTGGTHGAALFDVDGNLLALKEDVGRHNAVDKAVGVLLERGELHKASILFVSGRVSYEIAAKTRRAAIPFLVSVSAPSTLAVTLCEAWGITLICFCRGDRATAYARRERVVS